MSHSATHHSHPPHHHASHAQQLRAAHLLFFSQAAPAAQDSERQTGVPASITLAQLALESGWGKHHAGSANNYFGVKAHVKNGKLTDTDTTATGYVDRQTHEQLKSGKVITITAHFRSYTDMHASIVDHGKFLEDNQRYAAAINAYRATGDADAFARGLQQAGYATDHNYAAQLIRLMKDYDLYQYNVWKPAPGRCEVKDWF